MSSIYSVDPSDVEAFTVITNPIRTYTSSSTQGVTGSVHLFARRSHIQKDASPDSSFVEKTHNDADLSSLLRQVQQTGKQTRYNASVPKGTFNTILDQYMSGCAAQEQAQRLNTIIDPIRFSPGYELDSDMLRKLIIKDTLQPYYRTVYPSAHYAYSNYNSLNFFTASSVNSSTALLYPNISISGTTDPLWQDGHFVGTYTPSGSFSFDFYINPRYQQDQPEGEFKAGTILHLSSVYALSLVSGSAKDENGKTLGYRLQLQLSHSADIPPSQLAPSGDNGCAVGNIPGYSKRVDLAFLSDDNALLHNHWHHVVVRWGTQNINNGTGSFNIDGIDRGTFVIPSSTITPLTFKHYAVEFPGVPGFFEGQWNWQSASVLTVGNYFEGLNYSDSSQAKFFSETASLREGVKRIYRKAGDSIGSQPINGWGHTHPLNAELHNVAIRRCYVSDTDIVSSSSIGPTYLDKTYMFYVPPFFTEKSPRRTFQVTRGGVLISPFQEMNGTTTTPFSVGLSFGVAGHLINLENFVKDFVQNSYPLLCCLSASAISVTTGAETCNEFLYSNPKVVKRNLTILPCDDGNFVPGFQLLATESLRSRASDDLGIEELSYINIDKMVDPDTLLFGPGTFDDGSQPASKVNAFSNFLIGPSPEDPFVVAGPASAYYKTSSFLTLQWNIDVERGAPLTIYQRTQDPSSNQVTIFDISNMYYGFRIAPGTLSMQDPDIIRSSFLGSNKSITDVHGPVKITLADDGQGNIYRADCLTTQCKWNSVGNIYYNEGMILLKSPHLYFFGQDAYSMNFRGEQHVHVMKIDAFAPNNQLNSSSNPNFVSVPVNGYPNDVENEFVYISGLNFHDKDMNVVMKSSLAQPIAKRHGDRVLFKVKYDF